MTIASVQIESNATAREEVLAAKAVRILIAHRLGVDVKSVTDEAHFTDDFGADWLDRLELMIEIEAQFRTVEFTDDDVDQIHVVGDLIRHVKSARVAKGDDAAVASHEPTIGLSMLDALNLPFRTRNGTTRAFSRTMAKSFSARFWH
jgi:acyl carrier protein